MAKYETTLRGDLHSFIDFLENNQSRLGSSISLEDSSVYRIGDVNVAIYVLERYSYLGSNRVSLSITLVEYQNSINKEIAGYLVQLKNADTTNESKCYGFLPEDNKEYLEAYNDKDFFNTIKSTYVSIVSDAYCDVVYDDYFTNELHCYHIPQVNLGKNLADEVNAKIDNVCPRTCACARASALCLALCRPAYGLLSALFQSLQGQCLQVL